MTMSFVDIKNSHNLQGIIFNNIQRRKPRLGVKLKGTWQITVTFHGCALRSKKFVKMVNFQYKKALSNLFPMNIEGIKGIFLLLQNVFKMDQYVLELFEGLDNILANLSIIIFGIIY